MKLAIAAQIDDLAPEVNSAIEERPPHPAANGLAQTGGGHFLDCWIYMLALATAMIYSQSRFGA